MKTKSLLTALAAIALSLTATTPSHARRLGTEIEGIIQTVNLETKHATMLTKDGKAISFRWHETTKFTTATTLRKGAHIKAEYHESLFGESYVNRVDISDGKK